MWAPVYLLAGFVGVWAAVALFRRRVGALVRVIAFVGQALGLQGIAALWTGLLPAVAWDAGSDP